MSGIVTSLRIIECLKTPDPHQLLEKFRNAKKRIQSYVEDHTIGIDEVEETLDAARAIQFQTYRYGQTRYTKSSFMKNILDLSRLAKMMSTAFLI